jgi:IS5 family transposase
MLRIYFLQQWFNLSDPAVEEALYDSVVMRNFVGIDLGQEPVPDETTVCKFRHLLEEHGLGGEMLETVNLHLQEMTLVSSSKPLIDPPSGRNRASVPSRSSPSPTAIRRRTGRGSGAVGKELKAARTLPRAG